MDDLFPNQAQAIQVGTAMAIASSLETIHKEIIHLGTLLRNDVPDIHLSFLNTPNAPIQQSTPNPVQDETGNTAGLVHMERIKPMKGSESVQKTRFKRNKTISTLKGFCTAGPSKSTDGCSAWKVSTPARSRIKRAMAKSASTGLNLTQLRDRHRKRVPSPKNLMRFSCPYMVMIGGPRNRKPSHPCTFVGKSIRELGKHRQAVSHSFLHRSDGMPATSVLTHFNMKSMDKELPATIQQGFHCGHHNFNGEECIIGNGRLYQVERHMNKVVHLEDVIHRGTHCSICRTEFPSEEAAVYHLSQSLICGTTAGISRITDRSSLPPSNALICRKDNPMPRPSTSFACPFCDTVESDSSLFESHLLSCEAAP